jgi:uncharacterized RDD family membrane protein YckC
MRRIGTALLIFLSASVLIPAPKASAQTPTVPTAEAPPAPASRPTDVQDEPVRMARPVLRVGQDYTVRPGEAVRNLTVIFGDAVIEGRVEGDLVVVFGKAQLSSTAVIEGSLIVVGGSGSASVGSRVDRDLVIVGAGLDAPPEFTGGGQQIVIGPKALGGKLDAILPWIARGLLWGRLIVPDLPWVWGIVAVFFLVSLALNLVFDRPVRACAATLAEKPLTTLMVGLLVLLLTGPVCLLLAVSVIGLVVVPFVSCALVGAALIGRVGTARWIGMTVVPADAPEDRVQSFRSFVIGSALICVAYMVPVLGILTWVLIGVFGLGAATLAFITSYRRENPAPAPPVAPMATPSTGPYPQQSAPMPNHEPSAAVSQSVAVPAGGATDLLSFPHAFFRDRLAAFVLDVILVVIAQQILDLNRRDSALFLLLLAYHIGFWTWKGTTVGGIICQLRVVRVDGAPLRFVDALVRGLSSIFSLAVAGIGCLWILRDPERQAWHDKIAGTYVVRVPRNWPI